MTRAVLYATALLSAVILAGAAPMPVSGQARPAAAPTFSWRMEPRFGTSRADFAPVPVLTPTAEYIHAQQRLVHFDACGEGTQPQAGLTYAWRVDGQAPVQAGCRYDHVFSSLGAHRVELTAATLGGAVTTVQQIDLVDHLIVSFGDSYASGEGVPDVSGDYAIRFPPCLEDGGLIWTRPCVQGVSQPAQWSNHVCHRSSWAGPAQAALAIERGDPHSTVTFISLACSGAAIAQGLLGMHRGQPPQVDELARLLCPRPARCSRPDEQRRVDALVISIGGNDIFFSDVIDYCAKSVVGCTGPNIPQDSPVVTAQRTLARMEARYALLAQAIRERLNVAAVYLTENADGTLDDLGQPCIIGGFPYGLRIGRTDVAWLREHLLQKLNALERAAAAASRWVFIDGIAAQFSGHGYCATDRWFVTYPESWQRQGDQMGTMHPNRQGHQAYARRIADVVGAALR